MRTLRGALVAVTLTTMSHAQSAPPPDESPAPVATPRERSWSTYPSGHLQWGVGSGFGSQPGFRSSLDLRAGIGFDKHDAPLTLSAAVVSGFGKYPTYLSVEGGKVAFAGRGQWGGLAGASVRVGPAVRVDPTRGLGGTIAVGAYLFALQVGLRAIAVFTGDTEVQLQATLGIGFL